MAVDRNFGVYITPSGFGVMPGICDKNVDMHDVIKTYISGTIGLLPTYDYDTRFMCYIDTDAALKQSPSNAVATCVLEFLEFNVPFDEILGPVVIWGCGNTGLTIRQANLLTEICAMFIEDPDAIIAERLGFDKLAVLFGRTKAEKMMSMFDEEDIPDDYFVIEIPSVPSAPSSEVKENKPPPPVHSPPVPLPSSSSLYNDSSNTKERTASSSSSSLSKHNRSIVLEESEKGPCKKTRLA